MKGKTVFIMPAKVREGTEQSPIPEDECHVEMIISTSERDSHFSYMTEKTLRNYSEDCAGGNIPFTSGHFEKDISRQLGVIFEGNFDETGKRTIATARMLRDADDTPDPMRVNEYIRRFERSMYDSVSVEFIGGREICRIDQKPIWDFEGPNPCEHIPGREYNGVVCEYDVDDARLGGVALVARGSNPNAKITNLREWSPELLEAKKMNERVMSVEEKDGKLWRAKLIDDCVKEGIRSDAQFNETLWRERLNGWDAKAIQDQTRIFTKLGDERFQGGVQTTDGRAARSEKPVLIIPGY